MTQPFGDSEGAQRLPGAAAGEQPPRATVAADGGVAESGSDELAQEIVERCRDANRFSSQPQPDLLVGHLDVVDGEFADGRGGLSIEQHQQTGDTVAGVDGVVVQQPTGLIPAGLGVDDAARSAPSVGGMIDLGQFVFASPAYEVAAVTPKRLSAGQSGVKIALACRGECQLLCGEPIQQRDGGFCPGRRRLPRIPAGTHRYATPTRSPQSRSRHRCQR